jgi:hypothetical protein
MDRAAQRAAAARPVRWCQLGTAPAATATRWRTERRREPARRAHALDAFERLTRWCPLPSHPPPVARALPHPRAGGAFLASTSACKRPQTALHPSSFRLSTRAREPAPPLRLSSRAAQSHQASRSDRFLPRPRISTAAWLARPSFEHRIGTRTYATRRRDQLNATSKRHNGPRRPPDSLSAMQRPTEATKEKPAPEGLGSTRSADRGGHQGRPLRSNKLLARRGPVDASAAPPMPS